MHTNTGNSPQTLCIEDVSLQHMNVDTFYFDTSCMDIPPPVKFLGIDVAKLIKP